MAIIPPFNGGYCCGQLNIWAPEKTIYLQEDSSAILSPRLFREFLLPFHERIAGLAPHFSAMHTHASSIHVLREVLTNKNLKCVQIDIEPEGLKTKDLIRDFQAVQESGKCLMVQGDISDEETELLYKELSPEGLCIFIVRGFGQK